jgi:hypothetical protein
MATRVLIYGGSHEIRGGSHKTGAGLRLRPQSWADHPQKRRLVERLAR